MTFGQKHLKSPGCCWHRNTVMRCFFVVFFLTLNDLWLIIVTLFGYFQKVSISTFSRSRCALNPLSAHDWKWNEGMNVSIIRLMRLAWQRWQAWCVCWVKRNLSHVALSHWHTHTQTLAAGLDEEGQNAGRQKTDAIREQDAGRGENCVLVVCVDMVEWIIFMLTEIS